MKSGVPNHFLIVICGLTVLPGLSGYGSFSIGMKEYKAHRVAWEIHRGPIPKGLWVLHRCDTRSCVNPDHLFLGTVTDNNRDCEAKGRRPHLRGEAVPNSVLTEEKVRQIRTWPEGAWRTAKKFGVAKPTIQKIRKRLAWAHVT